MKDPFDEAEDLDNDYPEEFGFWDDKGRQSPLGPEGCQFPGECCMPGPHYESECHTAEMLMAQERELNKLNLTFKP